MLYQLDVRHYCVTSPWGKGVRRRTALAILTSVDESDWKELAVPRLAAVFAVLLASRLLLQLLTLNKHIYSQLAVHT